MKETLLENEFKVWVIKILTELREITDRNADHCNKKLETIKRDDSTAEVETNLEPMNSR